MRIGETPSTPWQRPLAEVRLMLPPSITSQEGDRRSVLTSTPSDLPRRAATAPKGSLGSSLGAALSATNPSASNRGSSSPRAGDHDHGKPSTDVSGDDAGVVSRWFFEHQGEIGFEFRGGGGAVWDSSLLFGPDASWGSVPFPIEHFGYTVIRRADGLKDHLDELWAIGS